MSKSSALKSTPNTVAIAMIQKGLAESAPTAVPVRMDMLALSVAKRVLSAVKALDLKAENADSKAAGIVLALLREPAAKSTKATAWEALAGGFGRVKGITLADTDSKLYDAGCREYIRVLGLAHAEAVKCRKAAGK